jgi:hypothetical protein
MGVHKDGEPLGLSPFETEMRRRVWWAFVYIDANYAILSGVNPSAKPADWDAQIPKNINDADLYPSSTQIIQDRDGPTEMVICLLFYNVINVMLGFSELNILKLWQNIFSPESTRDGLGSLNHVVEKISTTVQDVFSKYCDPSAGPHHQMAHHLENLFNYRMQTGQFLDKNQIISSSSSSSSGSTVSGTIFHLTVHCIEQTLSAYPFAEKCGYLWFWRTQFQKDMFVFMVGQLSQRTEDRLAETAWKSVRMAYHYHPELIDMTNKANIMLASHILKSWEEIRPRVVEQPDYDHEDEDFVQNLQSAFDSCAWGGKITAVSKSTENRPASEPTFAYLWAGNESDAAFADWEQLTNILSGGANQLNF